MTKLTLEFRNWKKLILERVRIDLGQTQAFGPSALRMPDHRCSIGLVLRYAVYLSMHRRRRHDRHVLLWDPNCSEPGFFWRVPEGQRRQRCRRYRWTYRPSNKHVGRLTSSVPHICSLSSECNGHPSVRQSCPTLACQSKHPRRPACSNNPRPFGFSYGLLLEVSEGVCAWRNLIVPDGRVDDANRVRVELVAEVHLRVTRAVLPQAADEQLPQRVVRATLHGILSAAAEFS